MWTQVYTRAPVHAEVEKMHSVYGECEFWVGGVGRKEDLRQAGPFGQALFQTLLGCQEGRAGRAWDSLRMHSTEMMTSEAWPSSMGWSVGRGPGRVGSF